MAKLNEIYLSSDGLDTGTTHITSFTTEISSFSTDNQIATAKAIYEASISGVTTDAYTRSESDANFLSASTIFVSGSDNEIQFRSGNTFGSSSNFYFNDNKINLTNDDYTTYYASDETLIYNPIESWLIKISPEEGINYISGSNEFLIETTKLTFSNGSYYKRLEDGDFTGDRTILLPDASGTIALTSDISSAITSAQYWESGNTFVVSVGGEIINIYPTIISKNVDYVRIENLLLGSSTNDVIKSLDKTTLSSNDDRIPSSYAVKDYVDDAISTNDLKTILTFNGSGSTYFTQNMTTNTSEFLTLKVIIKMDNNVSYYYGEPTYNKVQNIDGTVNIDDTGYKYIEANYYYSVENDGSNYRINLHGMSNDISWKVVLERIII